MGRQLSYFLQIPNSNVQLVLAPINATSVIQTAPQAQSSPAGLVNVASSVPLAGSTDNQPLSSDTSSSHALLPCAATGPVEQSSSKSLLSPNNQV